MANYSTRWQYLVLVREIEEVQRSLNRVAERENLEKVLDSYGDAGWELITVEFVEPGPWPDISDDPYPTRTRRYRFFMKRPPGESDSVPIIK